MEYKVSLAKFFEEYKFRGKIQLPSGESDFSIEVFKYDPEKMAFIASGEDERGLSAILGEIIPKNETEAKVDLKQIFGPNSPLDKVGYFSGTLKKTDGDVILSGKDLDPYKTKVISFELGTTIRRGLLHMGWRDKARYLELPR